MTIDVQLTVPQAIKICELIDRAERADFRTQGALQINGNELRVLRNAVRRLVGAMSRQVLPSRDRMLA